MACFRREGMPEQTHDQLAALGVHVDTTPYELSFEETVAYLAELVPAYDVVVSCQNVADIYPALDSLAVPPPLIEHGGLVSEALAGPKHHTSRYVGVCGTIRDAAATRMPGREDAALVIPSMVDLAPFRSGARDRVRAELGASPDELVVGWVGRLDRKKRVEVVLDAVALARRECPALTLWVVGGPDAFMPDYADDLADRAALPGLAGHVRFLGDRADVPELLQGMDVFVWLSEGEGMPHVVAEAGAAGLPVVVTPDNGVLEQVVDGTSGLFVPHRDAVAAADALVRLAGDADLRARLGAALRRHVEGAYATAVVLPQWLTLLEDVAREHEPLRPPPSPFGSFLLGGFECSTHRRSHDRERIDVLAATRHDLAPREDYRLLTEHGIRGVREGLRWHLIEPSPGAFDPTSADAQIAAAREQGITVIWDLLHYGWPDDLDIYSPAFPRRFAHYAARVARHLRSRLPAPRWYAPVNEISFLAWAGGDVAYLNPFDRGRGLELKVQLVRASIAAIEAIRGADPAARLLQPEPLLHVVPRAGRHSEAAAARGAHQAQYQAWDMLAGRAWPGLGGRRDLLDVVGVNYYPANQWEHFGDVLAGDDPRRRPFADLLAAVYARYGRPILVSETGTEGDDRASWFEAVHREVRRARRRGVPVLGLCLYPVLDHPGWDDDRYCPNGLLTWDPAGGGRGVHAALATALANHRGEPT